MAYADKYSEEMEDGNFDYEVTLSDVKAKMSEGSIEERIPLGATYSITGFKVGNAEYVIGNAEGEKITAESPLKIPTEGTKTLEIKTGIEVNGEAGEKRYFALVQGGYYEIRIANSKIEYINENPMTIEEINATGSSSASPTLGVTLKDGSSEIVTLGQVNQTNQKVDITGVATGDGIITVTYGTGNSIVSEEVNINVTGGYLVSFYNQKNNNNSIIASYTVAENDDARNYSQYLIPTTPPEEGKYFLNWLLNTNDSDATTSLNSVTQSLSVYSNWASPVKYAVQIYGINQDVDENDQPLGLTFGPATGDYYNNKYVTHRYKDNGDETYTLVKQVYTVGRENPVETELSVTRTNAEIALYGETIHDKTWAEIAAVTDKTKFTDCMLCGDTKSVSMNLNSAIKSSSTYTQRGDGSGSLFKSINHNNSYYCSVWNPSISLNAAATNGGTYGSNARFEGGYRTSHIRASLVGSTPTVTFAGDVNLDTSNCLYSCIESGLRNAITAKKINYVTWSSRSSYSKNSDISDKIWLFSVKELNGTNNAAYNTEGIGNVSGDEVAYEKFTTSSAGASSRMVFDEEDRNCEWWLRTPIVDDAHLVYYVDILGSMRYYANGRGIKTGSGSGLAFGFCIR